MKAPVEVVGTYRLILDSGHHLDLLETFYVPSIYRNFVSLPNLIKLDMYLNLVVVVSVCTKTLV